MSLLKMFDCIVSRRGKGAKGTVPVQTFGKPVANKKDRKTGKISKITKKWDYSHADAIKTEELIKAAKKVGPVNQIIMRGMDLVIRSSSIKSQGETAIIRARIVAESLAMDRAEATALASSWREAINTVARLIKMGAIPVTTALPTIDSFIAERKKAVAELKKAGTWKIKTDAEEEAEERKRKAILAAESQEPAEETDGQEPAEEEETDSDEEAEEETDEEEEADETEEE